MFVVFHLSISILPPRRLRAFVQRCICTHLCTCRGHRVFFEFVPAIPYRMLLQWSTSTAGPCWSNSHRRIPSFCSCMGLAQSVDPWPAEVQSYISHPVFPVRPWRSLSHRVCTLPRGSPSWLGSCRAFYWKTKCENDNSCWRSMKTCWVIELGWKLIFCPRLDKLHSNEIR